MDKKFTTLQKEVSIFYPIVPDFKMEKYPFEQLEIVVEEIRSIIGSKAIEFNDYIVSYEGAVSLENYNPAIHSRGFSGIKVPFDRERYLRFDFLIELNLTCFNAIQNPNGEYLYDDQVDVDSKNYIIEYCINHQLGMKLFEIFILSQIARPGSLKIEKGIVLVNGSIMKERVPSIFNSRPDLEAAIDWGYPPLNFFSLFDYYNWIIKKELLFTSGTAYSSALNDLTYINAEQNYVSKIIFQMRILEMIFTSGNQMIAEQLNTNIQVFLGPVHSIKKQIKNMYNARSRFIHGEYRSVPFHWGQYDSFEIENNKEDASLYDAQKCSYLLVLSTLQKMYKENLTSIIFEVSYK